MFRYDQPIPKSVWFRIVITVGLLITLLIVVGTELAHAQQGNILSISGNSDLITFEANWSVSSPILVRWGIESKPMVSQYVTLTNRSAQIVPPEGVVSLLFWEQETVVQTDFVVLGNGWYAVPQAVHYLTISGDTNGVIFTTNWDPTSPLFIRWGVENKPMVSVYVTITNRIVSVIPPAGTVSLLFWEPDITVSTNFLPLGSGWYQVPQAPPLSDPKIIGIEPTNARLGDIITISGDNFSVRNSDNQTLLGLYFTEVKTGLKTRFGSVSAHGWNNNTVVFMLRPDLKNATEYHVQVEYLNRLSNSYSYHTGYDHQIFTPFILH